MPILQCKNCGKQLKIPDKYRGTTGRCKKCHTHIYVPTLTEEAAGSSSPTPPPPSFTPNDIDRQLNAPSAFNKPPIMTAAPQSPPVSLEQKLNTITNGFRSLGCLVFVLPIAGILIYAFFFADTEISSAEHDVKVMVIMGEKIDPLKIQCTSTPFMDGVKVVVNNNGIFWWKNGTTYYVNGIAMSLAPNTRSAPQRVINAL